MKKIETVTLRVINGLIVACLAIMLGMVFLNATLRYTLNSGITVSEEISRWLFVWMTFLGAIVAMKKHLHLGVDIVVRRLSPKLQKACAIVSSLLMLYACYLLFWGSWVQAKINIGTISPASGIPVAVLYLVGIIASVGISIYLLVDLFMIVSGRSSNTVMVAAEGAQEAQEIVEKSQNSSSNKNP